ncbi:YczE/YyaS/YitT family protein [Lactococcus lactis]|uniref:YczE/YyaS/YitT family protein n=1 Tax=Lactococcus lactis TaxID=1358 RepID=UPI00223B7551|nr:hypothetical protein [Lactococcus lactis]
MKNKKYILSFLYYMLAAFGISLTIKAAVGVSSFNSMNVAIAEVTKIEVGTITTFVNLLFLIACFFIEKNKKFLEYLFMIISLVCFGSVINLFLYHLLFNVQIESYYLSIIVFIVGTIIAGYGTGRSLYYGILKFPIEKYCILLAEKYNKSFSFYRYGVDIFSILISLFVSIIFIIPMYVREGTLLSFVLLTFVINKSKN